MTALRGSFALVLLIALAVTLVACNPHSLKRERDRDSFWRRDHARRFGSELVFLLPNDSRLRLYENENPLQFHGMRRSLPSLKLPMKPVPSIDGESMGTSISSRRGNFVILLEKKSSTEPAGGAKPAGDSGSATHLASVMAGKSRLTVINIFSDGTGLLRAEAESQADRPDYYVWIVNSVRIQSE